MTNGNFSDQPFKSYSLRTKATQILSIRDGEGYVDQVHAFIAKHWNKTHPILDSSLFNWQYRGFGPLSDFSTFKVIVDESGELKGFRGVIPGVYQVPGKMGDGIELKNGGSGAMWMIEESLRGQGLGLQLFKTLEQTCEVIVGLGSNMKTAIPFYKKNHFTILPTLRRYILPLNDNFFPALCCEEISPSKLKKWTGTIFPHFVKPGEPTNPTVEDLEALWVQSTHPIQLFGLFRNREFWEWRYKNSCGYRYFFFGDPNSEGVIVAHLDYIHKADRQELNNKKVLRIIEIIPKSSSTWKRTKNIEMENLLRGVLAWAIQQECLAADFQFSSDRLENLLFSTGFKRQDINYGPSLCSLAGLFDPFKFRPAPINASWRIMRDGERLSIDPNDTYIVKSDNDMDRPNRIL